MANTPSHTPDFLVIGAGIMGITVARELRRRFRAKVVVIDKERGPGLHASGRNSGVLHAGIYYKAHSLKARLCVDGNRRMKQYCMEKRIRMNEHGKVIVTQREDELPALHELQARAEANGARAAVIDENALNELEPCAITVGQALHVEDTAVVDPATVMASLAEDAKHEGVELKFNCEWIGIDELGTANTSQGRLSFGHLVNCAGLFADRVAHQLGVGREYRILPFRGHYYYLSSESTVKVRGNIYPVPDLRHPFLGVHFTRRPDGEVTVGPSALPLMGREQYTGLTGANARDGLSMSRYLTRLFMANRDHFRAFAWKETRKVARSGFFKEACTLVVGLRKKDLIAGRQPGIRAQMVHSKTAELLNDFVLEIGPRSTHVLNAVSPAFTCSFPFAEYVVDNMKL